MDLESWPLDQDISVARLSFTVRSSGRGFRVSLAYLLALVLSLALKAFLVLGVTVVLTT